MLATDSHAVVLDPGRLLSRAGLRAAIDACRPRLPGYGAIWNALACLNRRNQIAALWRAVLPPAAGEPPVEKGIFDLEVSLVWAVDDHLFPIDLDAMNEYVSCGDAEDSTLECPIPIRGLGVPWELCPLESISDDAKPVLAAIAAQLAGGCDRDSGYDGEEDGGGLLIDVLHRELRDMDEEDEPALGCPEPAGDGLADDAAKWWREVAGREPPRWGLPAGEPGIRRLQEALRCQEPPLDGLADVVDTIFKDTGNPFLDNPSGFWVAEYEAEYGEYDAGWYWTPSDVAHLAALFDAVRPRAERLDALSRWYSDDWGRARPERIPQVADLLRRLAAGKWDIQNGKVIYHD